jgi:hypothetical protein
MNLAELLKFLDEKLGITVAERIPQSGGEVLIFRGTKPFPSDSRPHWFALPLKTGQQSVKKREIEALLRHFWQLQAEIPKSALSAAQSVGLQPLKGKN